MESKEQYLPFTKDRSVMVLAVLNSLLILVNTVVSLVRLHSHNFKIPVQYVVRDGSILQSADWYTLYSLTFFVLVGGIATILLAYRIHKGSRFFAIGILTAYFVVALMSLLIINALLGLVARV